MEDTTITAAETKIAGNGPQIVEGATGSRHPTEGESRAHAAGTPAPSSYTAMLYRRLYSHGFGNLPPGLKNETLEDLYATGTRREWDRVTELLPGWSDNRRLVVKTIRFSVKEQKIDYGHALDCLVLAMKDLSTDSVNPTIDAIPEEKIWTFGEAFQGLMNWLKKSQLPAPAVVY